MILKNGRKLQFIGTFEDWTVSKDRSGYYWYQKQEPKAEPKKDEISIEEPKTGEIMTEETKNESPKKDELKKSHDYSKEEVDYYYDVNGFVLGKVNSHDILKYDSDFNEFHH